VPTYCTGIMRVPTHPIQSSCFSAEWFRFVEQIDFQGAGLLRPRRIQRFRNSSRITGLLNSHLTLKLRGHVLSTQSICRNACLGPRGFGAGLFAQWPKYSNSRGCSRGLRPTSHCSRQDFTSNQEARTQLLRFFRVADRPADRVVNSYLISGAPPSTSRPAARPWIEFQKHLAGMS